jgi:hypothetical protein
MGPPIDPADTDHILPARVDVVVIGGGTPITLQSGL